jgi:type I restriction enzyme S subunit
MPNWKRVKINFPTMKLGQFIEPIKKTYADVANQEYSTVYGVSNTEGITITGKESSKIISKYIVLENNCFAYNPYRINVGSIGMNINGLKGCVSPAYVVFKTKDGLSPLFLFYYLKSDFGNHLINWYGNKGGVRNALRFDDLCKIDIPAFNEQEQDRLLKRLDLIKINIDILSLESANQSSYLSILRQAILQEAIEGKLTADWRKTHPELVTGENHASRLLEKIKTEKEQLVKEGKIKKEKPLPLIKDEEKPFDLPEGWVWCRLREICSKITDGTHHSPINTSKGLFKYITAKNIKDYGVDLSEITYVSENVHREIYKRCNPEMGDVLFVKDGATTGVVTINNLSDEFSMLSSVALLKPLILNRYLMYAMRSPVFYQATRKQMYGVAITRVTLDKIVHANISLPSLAEQQAIVEKVDRLMAMIDELEKQVQERKEQAGMLMQSVLREAFNGQ